MARSQENPDYNLPTHVPHGDKKLPLFAKVSFGAFAVGITTLIGTVAYGANELAEGDMNGARRAGVLVAGEAVALFVGAVGSTKIIDRQSKGR